MREKTLVIGAVSAAAIMLAVGAFLLGMKFMQNNQTVQESESEIQLEAQVTEISTTTEISISETTAEITEVTMLPEDAAVLTTEPSVPATVPLTTEAAATAAPQAAAPAVIEQPAAKAPDPEPEPEPQPQPANDPQSVALRAYAGVLRNYMNGNEYNGSSRYDLFDITQDGIPELFISVSDHSNPNDWRNGTVKVYTYAGGRSKELTAAIVTDYGWNGREENAYMIGFDGVLYARSGSGILKSHDTSYGGGASPGYSDSYYEYLNDGYIHWQADLMYQTMSGYAMASGTSGAGISEAEYQQYKKEYEGNGNLTPVGRQYYFPQSADDWTYVGDTYVG